MAAEPAISESGPRRRAVRLAPLRVPKASDVLADDLRERILRGDFPEGTAMAVDGTLAEFLQANVDWHVAVAVAGHNELLTGFMRALSRGIYASTDNQGFVDDDVRQTTLRAHRAVTKAIKAKDPDAARRR